jgi:hypothetical protein
MLCWACAVDCFVPSRTCAAFCWSCTFGVPRWAFVFFFERWQGKHGVELVQLIILLGVWLAQLFVWFSQVFVWTWQGKSFAGLARLFLLFRIGLAQLFDAVLLLRSPVRLSQDLVCAVVTEEMREKFC